METRNVKITIQQALNYYNSNNVALKALALSAFSKEEITFYYFKTQSKTISLDLPQNQVDKFKTIAQLSVIASFFNKFAITEDSTRYFIGKNYKTNIDFTDKLFDNIYIFKHVTVYYPGIIYFNNKEDVRKAVSILGEDKIKQLFNE